MQQSSGDYRSVVKSTIVFSGVKIVEIFVSLIRTKIIALFLGPSGIGIQTIFVSLLASINQFASLGVFQSSVRDISQAHVSENVIVLSKITRIVRCLSLVVAILAGCICAGLSYYWSILLFGNNKHILDFVLLAFGLIFWTLSYGEIAIMQGRRQLRNLALASLISAILSLLISVPFYSFFKISGIVPALIFGYIVAFIVNYYFSHRDIVYKQKKIELEEVKTTSIRIIKLGIILMISNLLMTLFGFITNIFINKFGNITDVGLFQSAYSVTFGNLSIIIAVLASDFYPRLASVHENNIEIRDIVNRQIELLMLIIFPVSLLLINFAPLAVKILFSKDFLIIVPLIRYMSVALILRVWWHSFSYIILAKADKKAYLIYDAIIGNGFNFILGVFCYYHWGLGGLCISYVVGSFLITLLLGFVVYKKYSYKVTMSNLLFLFSFIAIVFFILYIQFNFSGVIVDLVFFCVFFLSLIFIIYVFNKRIDLKRLILKLIK